MESLETDIKQLIIDTLNLEEISVDEIESQAALFGQDGLGLDSIDALELGLAVKKRFGVVLSAENEAMREHFYSVANLAAFIKNQNPAHSA
ncbi:phosphopantetheine-binding protein [Buttiauxella agrestis]|uniref:Acyl carrier protein n=1 Tax=Buttiauxella agrestis ATCC 33320 TaxID=1006004 RepID=A0A085GH29_9ENTR|nr:phosphopantetheine-binding protein [Buttiauxella agrestis]KFC83024.1 acyl carrier protein [Buttiauxella agrestis ATCC 33320]